MYNKFFQNASLHFWAAVLTAAVFYLKHIHSDYKEKEVEEIFSEWNMIKSKIAGQSRYCLLQKK